jgi:solute carrier family 25 carnitine/acylcarnitine transporter 20/29
MEWSDSLANSISHFAAGTIGGCLGVLAGHPFDTIKVRLQSQTVALGQSAQKQGALYLNTLHCLRRIVKEESIKGLFKGMSSPMAGVALVNAWLFSAYGSTLDLLGQDVTRPSWAAVWTAGAISGALNTIISCPIELAKIQLQNQLSTGQIDTNVLHSPGAKCDHPLRFSSPISVLRNNYRLAGIKGFNMGFWSTFMREAPSYAVYFASYEYFCRVLSPTGLAKDIHGVSLLFVGAASGVLAWASTYPWDVLKTKIQAQRLHSQDCYSQRKYHGWIQALRTCVQEEGWSSLFRGFGATMLRAVPTNAFIFFGFSMTMRLIQSRQ